MVEPYAFGYWLGNGSGDGVIYGRVGVDMLELHDRLGWVGRQEGRRIVDVPGLAQWARTSKLGLTGVKFIPDAYLEASTQDRLDLLEGLVDSMMDPDGTITTVKHQLAKDIVELLALLNEEAKLYEKNLLFEGRKVGVAWEIVWRCNRVESTG